MEFDKIVSFLCLIASVTFNFARGNNSTNSSRCSNSLPLSDVDLFSQPMTSFSTNSVGAPRIKSPSHSADPYSYSFFWETDSDSTQVECFKIRYRIQKEFRTNWTYDTVRANRSHLRLTGLESSSVYDVEIISLTNQSESSRVITSSFRTGFVKKKPSQPINGLPSSQTPSQSERNDKKSNATAQVPDPPADLKVVVTSKTSVTLTWVPRSNGGSPITGYKVQVRTMNGKRRKWKTKSRLQADQKACDIKGLRRDTSYKFRVIAINKIGESDPSAIAKQPNSDPQLNVPPDVCVKLLSNGSVSVQWTFDVIPPAVFDGFIVDYRYFVDNKRKRKRKRIRDSLVSSYEIIDPVQAAEYTVEVKAFNSLEKSPTSHTVRFTIVRDHAMKKDKMKTLESCDDHSPINGYPHGSNAGNGGSSYVIPGHNDKVKTTSNGRDIGIIIGGSVVCVTIFVLLSTCICYHKQRKLSNRKGGRVGALTEQPSSICVKLFASFCRQSKHDSASERSPSPPQPRCSCYSGTSSPVRANTSCIQSNRTSMSQGAIPENGVVAYPRVSGNPSMYTVYYDYPSNRVPSHCLPTPGIPICWLRGEGEFCHIIPHESRPKANEDLSCLENGNDVEETTSDAVLQSTSSCATTQPSTPEESESETNEIVPEQVALLNDDDENDVSGKSPDET